MQEQFKIKSSILLVSDQWTGAKKIYENEAFIKLNLLNDFFTNDMGYKFDGIIMRKSNMLY